MPWANENATAVVRKAPPTAISQPVRASARRSRHATSTAAPETSAKPRNQPAWPPMLWSSRRSQPVSPPKTPPPPAGPGVAAGAAGLAREPAEPVVAEYQRPDRVVRGARDPRPVRRRRERDDHGPEAARDDHRRATGRELPQCREA